MFSKFPLDDLRRKMGVLGAPVGGELAGDGGLQDGLAIAGEQLLHLAQRLFALVQPGEQRLDLLDDAALFVEGGKELETSRAIAQKDWLICDPFASQKRLLDFAFLGKYQPK